MKVSSRYYGFVLKLLVSTGLIWLAITQANITTDSFDISFLGSSFYLLFIIGLLIINLFSVSYRWYVSIRYSGTGHAIGFSKTLYYQYLSMFGSLLLPTQLAHTVGRVGLLKIEKIPISKGISSVLLDRVSVVGGLIMFSVLSLSCILAFVEMASYDVLLLSALLIVLVSIAASFFYVPYIMVYVLHGFIRKKYRFSLLRTASTVLKLFKNRQLFLATFSATLVSTLTSILIFWVLIQSQGLAVEFMMVFLLVPVVMFVAALPISYNGWGVRELSVVYLFGMLGMDKESAVVISVQYGILYTVFSLIGGIGVLKLVFRR